MIAALRYLRDCGPAYVAGLGVAFLIAADVLRATGWQWADVAALVKELVPEGGPREIKNYVEFTTVPAGTLTVTTGVKFASSIEEGRITLQWCYAEPQTSPGAARSNLQLAEVDGRNAPKLAELTEADLRPFGLTADAAQTLLTTYCRFR